MASLWNSDLRNELEKLKKGQKGAAGKEDMRQLLFFVLFFVLFFEISIRKGKGLL